MSRFLSLVLTLALFACGTESGPGTSGPTTVPPDTSTSSTSVPNTTATTTSTVPQTTSTTEATTPSSTVADTTPTSAAATPPPTQPGGDPEVITPQGFWEVRVGETLSANEARLGGAFDDLGGDPTSCLVLQLPEVGGLYFIAATPTGDPVSDRGRLVVGRVSTEQPGWPTDTGVEVGMAVSDAEAILGDTVVERRPHAYREEGEYLVVGGPEARYVFETDGSEIVALHAGIEPAVSFIEACS